MSKIKTFEGACKALKLDPAKVLPKVNGFPKEHQEALIAHAKLIIIAQALNGGWQPDWNNSDEYKYWPYFRVIPNNKSLSGFGLSYSDYDFWSANTCVGSRLCFKSSELAEYAGKQFKVLYEASYLLGS